LQPFAAKQDQVTALTIYPPKESKATAAIQQSLAAEQLKI